MSTKSNQLRAALRAYVAWLDDIDNEGAYEAYSDLRDDLNAIYGGARVRICMRQYRGAVTVLTKNGVIYKRM